MLAFSTFPAMAAFGPGNDHLTSPDGKAQHMLESRQCAFRFGSYVMMGQPDFDLR